MSPHQFASNHPDLSVFASVVALIAVGACMSSSGGTLAAEVAAAEVTGGAVAVAASKDAGAPSGFEVTAAEIMANASASDRRP